MIVLDMCWRWSYQTGSRNALLSKFVRANTLLVDDLLKRPQEEEEQEHTHTHTLTFRFLCLSNE